MKISSFFRLFARSQFPLHHAWLRLLSDAVDSEKQNQELLDEATDIANIMGHSYTALLSSVLEGNPDVLNQLLSLKIDAKKRKANYGVEFPNNVDAINSKLSRSILATEQRELKQIEQQRQQREEELERRRVATERMFAERRAEYNHKYIDFDSLKITEIRKRSKAASILSALTEGKVVADADYLWLKQKGFANSLVNNMFYLHRAERSLQKWNTTNKPWNLVNALADYRKAEHSNSALMLVDRHSPYKFANGNKKLKSALLTTSGGVKRDLAMYDQAIEFGLQAHELTQQDYRPCTLIGACKMLSGHISEGHDWYRQAIERGFEANSYEQEIRSIYSRAKASDKAKMRKLLHDDGWHYKWLK